MCTARFHNLIKSKTHIIKLSSVMFFLILFAQTEVSGQNDPVPDDCTANYKKGFDSYNKGIRVIYDTTSGNDHSGNVLGKHFREALPFLLKADSLCPNDSSVIQALMGIYYTFNDNDKYLRYKKKLAAGKVKK
jgi:hypothetical protein